MAVSEEVVEVTVREFDASSLVTVTLARSRHSACRAVRGRWQEQYRHAEGWQWECPRGHLFKLRVQESGCKPASSHWAGIRAHSPLACGNCLWSNKWHWFCGARVFVAICILILSIFDVSGRGWEVMWKMTPPSAWEPMRHGQNTVGNPAIKVMPCSATLQSIIFKLGSLHIIGTYRKDCSDYNSHFSQHPL